VRWQREWSKWNMESRDRGQFDLLLSHRLPEAVEDSPFVSITAEWMRDFSTILTRLYIVHTRRGREP
jgi:hypothetical protein